MSKPPKRQTVRLTSKARCHKEAFEFGVGNHLRKVFPHESICPGVRSVNNRELKEFRLNYMLRKLGMAGKLFASFKVPEERSEKA